MKHRVWNSGHGSMRIIGSSLANCNARPTVAPGRRLATGTFPEELRQQRRAAGLCIRCGGSRDNGTQVCTGCKDRLARRKKEREAVNGECDE